MHYEEMTQLALRGVVRDAIRRVIREDGLPGEHHFFITFLTRYPGVEIDASLAEKYPDEIKIVLEHQFWELSAPDDFFEVTLKFAGVPKYLKVPYLAITRFHDPSVGFALQFDRPADMELKPAPISEIAPKPAPKPKAAPAPKAQAKPKASPKKKSAKKAQDTNTSAADKTTDAAAAPKSDEDNVVSLDTFRKK